MTLGVLYHIPEHHLENLLTAIADNLSSAELVFDACSQTGLRIANKRVIQDGGMSEDARLVWALGDPREIERWDARIALLDSYSPFLKRGRSFSE